MSTFLGVAPQPDDEDGNPVESQFDMTSDSKRVALSILNNEGVNWFNIKETGGNQITTPRVILKPGNRAAAPAEEVVEIVAVGKPNDVLGSVEVDV